ncbi:MAG: IS110 family transposase [bacterium]|nr:IS110 family transposase [bacterium]
MTQHSTAMPTRTIGIDLGDRESAYCVLNEAGEIIEQDSLRNERTALEERFGSDLQARIVIEASGQSQWICRCLEGLGHEVIVANPRQVQLISKSVRKTDRNDAQLLARLGRMDPELLRPVTTRSEESAAVRALLRARCQLVATRTRLVDMVRGETKVTGSRIPTCSAESFHRQARAHLPPALRSALEPLLEVLAELQLRVRAYDKQIDVLSAKDYPETQVLRQVAGVGPLVALTYVVTIDDPRRFRRSRALGSFLGLAPRSFQSGERDSQLRISEAGDPEMRRLLVGAASYVLRKASPDCDLKRYGMRIARGGSKRDRARARVAVARKLAVLLHRLWLTGEVYDPDYTAKRAA